jgi:hypothetical protein
MTYGIDKTFNVLVPIEQWENNKTGPNAGGVYTLDDPQHPSVPSPEPWDSNRRYGKGDRAFAGTGYPTLYESLQYDNLNNTPASSPTWWKVSDFEDYYVWSSSVSYAVGQRVRIASVIYESVQAANLNKSPLTKANIGTWWIVYSRENLLKALDNSLSTATVASGKTLDYFVSFIDRKINTIAISKLDEGEVFIAKIAKNYSGIFRNRFFSSEYLDRFYIALSGSVFTGERQKGPWGAYTAYELQEGTNNGEHRIDPGVAGALTAGLAYTFSVYLKRWSGARNARLRILGPSNTVQGEARFDLGAGTFTLVSGASAAITPAGNGWYRCAVSIASATALANNIANTRILFEDEAGNVSYQGSGSNVLLIGRLQMEQASAASAYQITDCIYNICGDIVSTHVINTSHLTVLSDWFLSAGDVNDKGVWIDAPPAVAGAAPGQFTAIFDDITADDDYTLQVVIHSYKGPAKAGEFVAGNSYPVGRSTLPVKLGLIDFSQTERNDFGDFNFGATALVKRGSVETVEITIHIEADEAMWVRGLLNAIRATPFMIYDTERRNGWGITTFGIWRDFDIEILAPNAAMLRLKMESL